MDNPNLLNCLVLARNTLPLSFTLPLFFYLSPLPFFFLIYLSYSIPLSSFFPHSLPPYSSLPPSLSIIPSFSLPSSLPLPFPFRTHSSLPLFCLSSFRHALPLNPTLHDTSYSSIFLSLSILSFIFISLPLFLHPSPFPPALCFSITHIKTF